MFLLDTNVVCELRKAGSSNEELGVVRWAASMPSSRLYLSVVTILELEIGVLRVERRDVLQGEILRTWLDERVLPAFDGRILPFDALAARYCAQLHVPDPQSDRDSFIAATALTHELTVVTRNTRDFESMGIELLNPWEL